MTSRNPTPEIWRPMTGLPQGAEQWAIPGYGELAAEWQAIRDVLKNRDQPRAFVDLWLKERLRAFAIETGQIEGLYTLRRGVTEQLIAEGLSGVVGAQTLEKLEDGTIRGLLEDQESALHMVFDDIAAGRPLTAHAVRAWHQLVTSHQKTVTGIGLGGQRVQVPFRTRGQWKIRPNNPTRRDGVVHEYCPPERVPDEMERFFALHAEVESRRYPVEVEAGWMHHRFVRTHPFEDGNGRISRLLMAYAYVKRGLPPPIVTAAGRDDYIEALESADEGDLRAFCQHVGGLSYATLTSAVGIGRRALRGRLDRPTGNGGRVFGTEYLPP